MSSGAKIYIVEDEPSIAEITALYLRRAGFQVSVVSDGQAAIDLLGQALPDLLILDLMVPGVDGYEITRWLRDRSDVPIIMATARRSESDRIAGLEMGADDYVIKPFSPQELVSRVRAVLRRTYSATAQPVEQLVLVYGDLRIDPQSRQVQLGEEEISFTAKEFDLLYYLAKHPRQVFTRDQLLEHLWGMSDFIDASTVTVHIRRLREKLEAASGTQKYILTVWGVGYKFEFQEKR